MANRVNADLLRNWVVCEAKIGATLSKTTAPSRPAKEEFIALPLVGARDLSERNPDRAAPWYDKGMDRLASKFGGPMRGLAARVAGMIRIDAVWLAVTPIDMRAGTDTALARVVAVFGSARPHHAHLFINRRANRLKVPFHDGFGLWLCARRLYQGRFVWPMNTGSAQLELTRAQFDALVIALPWRRIGAQNTIALV